jgi:hypothetical protein
MAEGYVKILSSILDSSIWAEPDDVVRVWVTMLAMANRDGYVGASAGGIAARSRTVSRERVSECLAMFEAPDPDSRSEEYEGRRIQKVDRGWLILNYKKIRDMHGAEAVKASKRAWWANNRGKAAGNLASLEPSKLEALESSDNTRRKPMDTGSVSSVDLISGLTRARALPSEEPTIETPAAPALPPTPDPTRLAMAPRDPLAVDLFVAWQTAAGKPGARLDGKRASLFQRLAAEGVTAEEVTRAVNGAKLDDWAVNEAKLGAPQILSSADQREKYIAMLETPPLPKQQRGQSPPQPNSGYQAKQL